MGISKNITVKDITFRRIIICDKIADAELIMNEYLYKLSQRKDVIEEDKTIYKTDRKVREIIFYSGTKYIFTSKEKYYGGTHHKKWDDHVLTYEEFKECMQTYVNYPNIDYGPPD